MREKLIGLEDLPENFRVGLEEIFRNYIFNEAITKVGIKNLAKELNYCYDTILNLKKGKFFIKISTLIKLSKITGISLEEIETNVKEMKIRNKDKKITLKLPIYSSPELATLVACGIGDGSLTDRQFSYFNSRWELIDRIIDCVQSSISPDIEPVGFEKNGGWEIEFPTCIAKILEIAGIPKGKKLNAVFDVPNWIKNGDKKIKVAFIRALFDDEGWIKIYYNKKNKSTKRLIGINMSKKEEIISSQITFFESVRKMLNDLGIETSKINIFGKTKNGISLGFTISNFKNLKKFREVVNFLNLEREYKLLDCLLNYKRIRFKL